MFRELMHPSQAKMEIAVAVDLQRLGFNISMSEHYDLKLPPNQFYLHREKITTWPDIELLDYNFLVYIDGWAVHKNRQDRDEFMRQLLTEQYPSVHVLVCHYKRYSQKRRRQIVQEIREGARVAV